MLDFPDCLAEGKVWDGLDVQTYNWNLVDARESVSVSARVDCIVQAEALLRRGAERTACQMVYLRGVPVDNGGEQAAEGAFVISPSEQPSASASAHVPTPATDRRCRRSKYDTVIDE